MNYTNKQALNKHLKLKFDLFNDITRLQVKNHQLLDVKHVVFVMLVKGNPCFFQYRQYTFYTFMQNNVKHNINTEIGE